MDPDLKHGSHLTGTPLTPTIPLTSFAKITTILTPTMIMIMITPQKLLVTLTPTRSY